MTGVADGLGDPDRQLRTWPQGGQGVAGDQRHAFTGTGLLIAAAHRRILDIEVRVGGADGNSEAGYGGQSEVHMPV